jgi:hypothetical protein
MSKIFQFLLLVTIVTFASCKKTVVKTNQDYLVGHRWITTAAVAEPGLKNPNGGGPITDIFNYDAIYEACDRDNLDVYQEDLHYYLDEGSSRCGNYQSFCIGSWSLDPSQKILTIEPANTKEASYTYEIIDLDDTTFKYKRLIKISGVSYTITVTQKAQ